MTRGGVKMLNFFFLFISFFLHSPFDQDADVLHGFGSAEHRKGDLVAALKYYGRSLSLRSGAKAGDAVAAARTYMNVASIYAEQR